MSVVEQHVKIFECDGCHVQSEQEPQVSQIEGWVRITERMGSGTRLWDFCSWECAGSSLASGPSDEGGAMIEDEPARRGRRRAEA